MALASADAGSTLPAPPWWNGSTCDSAHYPKGASYQLPGPGASYRGVHACGPLPIDGGADFAVAFTGFGASPAMVLEWECVELSKRFMYLAYGIPVYGSDGFNIATRYAKKYPDGVLQLVQNDGHGPLPVPGDVLQFGNEYSVSSAVVPDCKVVVPKCNYGHTAVVTGVQYDSTGKATGINVMEQNMSATGARRLLVNQAGIVIGTPYGVTAWLHQRGAVVPVPVGPNPTPSVTSVSPSPMVANGQKQALTITGSSFAPGDVVQFRWAQGVGANTWNFSTANASVNSPSQITIGMNPGNVSDVINVRVCSDGGATACSDGSANIVVTAASSGVPSVSSVSPTSMNANGQTQTLTINGSSFAPGDVVQFEWGKGLGAGSWHSSNTSPTVADNTQITVPMNPGTDNDTIYVRVCSGSTASCSSGTASVTVNASTGLVPVVSGLSPSSMTANGQTQTLTIDGSGFAAGDIVQYKWTQGAGAFTWNTSNAAPQLLSSTQMSVGLNPGNTSDVINVRICKSSTALTCTDGNVAVTVSAPVVAAAPSVSSVSPTSMIANGSTQSLTISGSAFAASDIVQFKWTQGSGAGVWNTSNSTPSVSAPSQISVGLNPGTVNDTISVRVCSSSAATNCSNGSASVVVTAPALTPSVSSVSPTSMTANGSTQSLAIYGSSFAAGDIVQFKWTQGSGAGVWNTSNSTPSVLSSSQISVGLNPGTVNDTISVRVCSSSAATNCSNGSASVVVTAPALTPSVSSVSPTSMTANGSTQSLAIYGSSFAAGDIVQFKWTQGSGAGVWNTSNSTPQVVSSGQISVGMNPGTVTDTIYVRVCNSAATACSSGVQYVSVKH